MIDSVACPFNEDGLPAAYALDALDAAERARFAAHLAGCATCRAEVAAARATVAQLPLAVDDPAEAPSPALRTRLLDAVAADLAAAPAEPVLPDRRPVAGDESGLAMPAPAAPAPLASRRRGRFAYAAAAVLLIGLSLGLLGWNLALQRQVREANAALGEARAALAVYTIGARDGRSPSAEVLYLPGHQRAILVASNLPPLPPGYVYQVWLIQPGSAPEGVGILVSPSGETGFTGDLARYQTLAITIEPGYGSRAPTSAPVLAGALH